MNKLKVGRFYVDIYRVNIYLLPWCENISLSKWIKNQFGFDYHCDNSYAGRTTEIITKDRPTDYVISIDNWKWTNLYMGCLSHECLHIAMFILEQRKVLFDGANSEQLTYLQEFLLRKCLDIIKEKDFKEVKI